MQSENLTRFYKAYADWLDDGAPDDEPFSRNDGLCCNLKKVFLFGCDLPTIFRLNCEMRNQFGNTKLNRQFPFGGERKYLRENLRGTMHLNPLRVKWVREHAI